MDTMGLSVEHLAFSVKRLALSVERLALSVKRLVLSVERLALSVERLALSVERLAFGIGCWLLLSGASFGSQASVASYQDASDPDAQSSTLNAQRSTLNPQRSTLNAHPPDEITVTGNGMAAFSGDIVAAEEEAVWDAKRNAVEQAAGLFVKVKTTGRNFGIEEDEIQGRTQGFVRRWEVVAGSRRVETVPTGAGSTSRVLHIQVRATVGLLSLIHKLSDIADVYKDLERPRVRVQIVGKGGYADAAHHLQEGLAGALHAQGFDVASEGAAEIVLQGALDVVPTIHIGDKNAPYGVGDMVAACRVRLTLQAVSTSSEDVLFSRRSESAGRSFQDDADALTDATTQILQTALNDSETEFVPHLLAGWARERQEGHVIVVRVDGLTVPECARLKQTLVDMRGFRHFENEQRDAHRFTLRLLTRQDTRSLRRDLALFPLNRSNPDHSHSAHSDPIRANARAAFGPSQPSSTPTGSCLLVLNDRGPIIQCAAR